MVKTRLMPAPEFRTWELVASELTRIRVAGGWLYRTIAYNNYNDEGTVAVALAFVPIRLAETHPIHMQEYPIEENEDEELTD